jgi:hypothetical protein
MIRARPLHYDPPKGFAPKRRLAPKVPRLHLKSKNKTLGGKIRGFRRKTSPLIGACPRQRLAADRQRCNLASWLATSSRMSRLSSGTGGSL